MKYLSAALILVCMASFGYAQEVLSEYWPPDPEPALSRVGAPMGPLASNVYPATVNQYHKGGWHTCPTTNDLPAYLLEDGTVLYATDASKLYMYMSDAWTEIELGGGLSGPLSYTNLQWTGAGAAGPYPRTNGFLVAMATNANSYIAQVADLSNLAGSALFLPQTGSDASVLWSAPHPMAGYGTYWTNSPYLASLLLTNSLTLSNGATASFRGYMELQGNVTGVGYPTFTVKERFSGNPRVRLGEGGQQGYIKLWNDVIEGTLQHMPAGTLAWDKNMAVSSNLTANTITLGGITRATWPTFGGEGATNTYQYWIKENDTNVLLTTDGTYIYKQYYSTGTLLSNPVSRIIDILSIGDLQANLNMNRYSITNLLNIYGIRPASGSGSSMYIKAADAGAAGVVPSPVGGTLTLHAGVNYNTTVVSSVYASLPLVLESTLGVGGPRYTFYTNYWRHLFASGYGGRLGFRGSWDSSTNYEFSIRKYGPEAVATNREFSFLNTLSVPGIKLGTNTIITNWPVPIAFTTVTGTPHTLESAQLLTLGTSTSLYGRLQFIDALDPAQNTSFDFANGDMYVIQDGHATALITMGELGPPGNMPTFNGKALAVDGYVQENHTGNVTINGNLSISNTFRADTVQAKATPYGAGSVGSNLYVKGGDVTYLPGGAKGGDLILSGGIASGAYSTNGAVKILDTPLIVTNAGHTNYVLADELYVGSILGTRIGDYFITYGQQPRITFDDLQLQGDWSTWGSLTIYNGSLTATNIILGGVSMTNWPSGGGGITNFGITANDAYRGDWGASVSNRAGIATNFGTGASQAYRGDWGAAISNAVNDRLTTSISPQIIPPSANPVLPTGGTNRYAQLLVPNQNTVISLPTRDTNKWEAIRLDVYAGAYVVTINSSNVLNTALVSFYNNQTTTVQFDGRPYSTNWIASQLW